MTVVDDARATLAMLASLGERLLASHEEPPIDMAGGIGGQRLAEARYRALVEQIPAVTFVASLAGGSNAIYVSPQIEQLLGFTPKEWSEHPTIWWKQTHPEDRARVSERFARTVLTGERFQDVFRVITKDGRTRWVQAEAQLVQDEGRIMFLQGVGFDITQQVEAAEAERALVREQVARANAARERDRLRSVFTSLPAAVWLLRGDEGAIEFANPLAEELSPTRGLAPGVTLKEAFPALAELIAPLLARLHAVGSVAAARELRINEGTDRERSLNVVCQRLQDDRGMFTVVHASDVTTEMRARDALARALLMREEFIAIASHELRTPVTAIKGRAQLALRQLARGRLDGTAMRDTLEEFVAGSVRLTQLVSKLLDATRLHAGKPIVERGALEVAPLVRSAATTIQMLGRDRPITLDLEDGITIEADALRVEQVMTNLLENAVKYSPEGTPVEVTASQRDGWVEIAVRDHGPGIPPDRRVHLFERFYQATDQRGGLGLGLYITRQIVELHGGDIRLESPGDGGARFVVRLPLHRGT